MTGNEPGPELALTPEHNIAEFTVGEISRAVKRTLEGAFERVRVRGEVSRPNYHGSGHLYFTLKDEEAVLDAVCWRAGVARLGLTLEEGMEVICTGRLSSYPRSSKYQIVIEAVELAGEGALLKLLEERRRRLGAEGLFDPDRRKDIPFLPEIIGVITSPTGAVIRDILHRLRDRFPRHVILWPAPVQGEGAAEKIAAAIAGFNALAPGGAIPRPDLLIVARGGGSLEDLWAFNEEVVVRAAAASDIPLISAVGHETDTTLIDFVADLRAPTPTAAAEMAVPVRAELMARILDGSRRLVGALERGWEDRRVRLAGLGRGLPQPDRLLEEARQRLDGASDRLQFASLTGLASRKDKIDGLGSRLRHPRDVMRAAEDRLAQCGNRLKPLIERLLTTLSDRLEGQGRHLRSVSYERVLERGFAVVLDENGKLVQRGAGLSKGERVEIRFSDLVRGATIDGDGTPPARKAPSKPSPRGKTPSSRGGEGGQGSLL